MFRYLITLLPLFLFTIKAYIIYLICVNSKKVMIFTEKQIGAAR